MIGIQPFQGRRLHFESARSFDDVLERLRQKVPQAMPTEKFPSAVEKAGGFNLASFERVIKSQVGESGFMLFHEINHSVWLPFYGIHRKVMRWILGNPLIAITMMRHDLEAGLFAPVELLLIDKENGNGSTVIYDLPSSLMVIGSNSPLLQAAQVLDAKLESLVRSATDKS